MTPRGPGLGTRASLAPALQREDCTRCGKRVGEREVAVACNVYEGARWDRLEWFHARCYDEVGKPYGEPRSYHRAPLVGLPVVHALRTCRHCGCDFLGPRAGRPSCDICRDAHRRGAA